jgi:LPS sulfotransferase NodH
MTVDRPIIVVGCPRSGTTMLQLMLHAHGRIAIPPETRFLLTAYWQRSEFGDLGRAENRYRLARWIVDRPATRFTDLGLDGERIVREITAGPGTLGSALGVVFRAYARRFGKPRWGDKRPAYLQNLDVILRLFPNAQIINVVRDGRACVASLREMSWHSEDLYGTIAAWARAVDDARRAARRLDRSQWHQLRYEDLVADPHTVLSAVCDFLGEDYDPAMASPSALAEVAVPKFKTWHRRTHEPVTTQRVESWQQRLSAAEIAFCEAALGSRLREYGYELSGAPRPRRSELIRYGLRSVRHRLAPAKRASAQVASRIGLEPEVALAPTVTAPRKP